MTESANAPNPHDGLSSEGEGGRARCPVAVHAERSPDAPAVVGPGILGSGSVGSGRVGSGNFASWADLDRMIAERVRIRAGAPNILAVRAEPRTGLVVEIFAAARRGRAIVLVPPRLPAGPAERFVRETKAEWVDPAAESQDMEESAPSTIHAPDEPLTFMQTSGSSGRPRTIVHSWHNHAASAAVALDELHLTAQDRWLWSLPPHHVGGLSILFRCALAGTAIVLPGASPLRSALVETESTIVSCVPVQLKRMVDEGPSPPGLRNAIVGGAPIEATLIGAAISAGYPVRTTYGCTESASMMTLSERFDEAPEIVHAGPPLRPGTVGIGSDGSIRLRGNTLAVGSLEHGNLHSILDSDGWYTSGDEGTFDDDGNLVVTGRIDDVIVSGGENISTRAVERALMEMDGVRSVIVVPVPSAEFGQRPIAFIDSEHPIPDIADVRRHLANRLQGFMHPDAVIRLGSPPEGHLKWPRHLLVERAISSLT